MSGLEHQSIVTPARDIFATHGLRCTRQRLAIYETLRETRTHPTAEELYHRVKPRCERMSLATVYNTLETLSRVGVVRKLPTGGPVRFDADMTDHLHVRLSGTNEMVDVPPALSRRLLSQLSGDVLSHIGAELGVDIDAVEVQLVGRAATQAESAAEDAR